MSLKYKALLQQLQNRIRTQRLQGEMKLPTEAQLCEQYGVSRQTVRRALAFLEEADLIVRRQGCGTYIRHFCSPESKEIAVIISYIDQYIFPQLIGEIESFFSTEGYTIKIYTTGNSVYRERQILKELSQCIFAGLLVEGVKTAMPNPNVDLYEQIIAAHMPLVFIHGTYRNLERTVCISDDNFAGGYLLTNYLLEQGHHRIGGIFKSDDLQGHLRYDGCITALREHNAIQPDENFLWYTTEDISDTLFSHNMKTFEHYIAQNGKTLSALVCYNDKVAYDLIRLLLQMQYRVPEDIAVVSFDNSALAKLSPVPITSLGHTGYSVGNVAARVLLWMIHGEVPSSNLVPWKLFKRESG